MLERTKKIIFAVFFVIFSIGMGYGLYWMFFVGKPTLAPQPTPEELAGQLPAAGVGVPVVAVTPTAPGVLPSGEFIPPTPITGPTQPAAEVKTRLLYDGITQAVTESPTGDGARYYNPEDGRFYKITDDGSISLLSLKQFFNVDKVSWGNQEDQAILEFPDGSNVYYDFNAKRQVTLPAHWEEFDFAANDSRVAAKSMGVDVNNRWLMISNPDGTEAKALEALGNNASKAHVSWDPQGDIVAYAETGQLRGNNEQEILFVGKNHENFKGLIAPGQDFLPNWSPTGKQLLFSVWHPDSRNRPVLWITSGETADIGANRRNLQINTWADKCVWASDSLLYCGVPQNLPDNAGIKRDDFANLPDDVYRVNLDTGISQKINTPDQNYTIRQPVLNRDKTKLIFSDANSGKLYSYDVK
ncbi:MAG: hypothetical protein ABIB04_03520 [Patescibacteria group bacterium]